MAVVELVELVPTPLTVGIVPPGVVGEDAGIDPEEHGHPSLI